MDNINYHDGTMKWVNIPSIPTSNNDPCLAPDFVGTAIDSH